MNSERYSYNGKRKYPIVLPRSMPCRTWPSTRYPFHQCRCRKPGRYPKISALHKVSGKFYKLLHPKTNYSELTRNQGDLLVFLRTYKAFFLYTKLLVHMNIQ